MSAQKVRLGDLVEVVNDNEYEPLKNGLTKYVAGEHLESEKLHITRFGNIERDKEVIGSAFHRKFSKGHVLFGTRRAYLRKTGVVTFDGICANTTLVLKPKQNGLIEGLLPFIVRLEKFTEHAVNRSVGSTNPYVRWRDLAAFEFELPSEPEQLKIKETLWSIQNSIDNLENLLEKTKIYSISTRESLLTRGIGHTKFKKVKWMFGKTIEIPEEWEMVKIDNLVKNKIIIGIQDGNHGELHPKSIDFVKKGIPFITADCLIGNTLDYKKCKLLPEIFLKTLRTGFSKKDDVILSHKGSIGNTAIINDEFETIILSPQTTYYRLSDKLLPQFLYYVFQSLNFQKQLKAFAKQSTRDYVGIIAQQQLIIPYFNNISEQQKIVSIISNINDQILQQQSHLTNLYALQDSILNSKLTKEETIVAN